MEKENSSIGLTPEHPEKTVKNAKKNKPFKKLKESLKIHGNRQFEVKQRVRFSPQAREVSYSVETYFFLPSALQINKGTFQKSEFQKNLKSYVRMQAPGTTLKAILAPGGEFDKLSAFLANIPQAHTIEAEGEYEDELKRFSLAFKRCLSKKARALGAREDCSGQSIENFVGNVREILARYRSLAPIAREYGRVVESNTFEYCDEYLSIVTTYYLKQLYYQLPASSKDSVKLLWMEESKYQEEKYPIEQLPGETKETTFLLRWSSLKKFVSSCLFLDIRYKKPAPLIRHTIYGIAAALSMVFATVIAFKWQDEYGSLSMNLFIALVIAYIFKDRIKEISREWLQEVFRRWIPDRLLQIYREPNIEVGTCRESFDSLTLDKIPQFVRELRESSHWINLVHDRREDNVFLYKKEITIKNHQELFQKTRSGLIDITRFNISDFLRNIDGRFEELPTFAEDEEHLLGEKLYHIYVMRVVNFKGKSDTEVVRIVVNVDGIKRIMLVKPFSHGSSDLASATSTDSLEDAVN